MSYEELDRVGVIERVIERRLTQREAGRMLGVTSRQVRRLRRAYERDGPAGLASKHRGRPSNGRLASELRREAGEPIRGSHKLQRLLAEARRPGAFPDRIFWLIEWRQRLEISQKVAARRLGYSTRSSVSDVERGLRRPSWEKILIAIVEEEQGPGSERRET